MGATILFALGFTWLNILVNEKLGVFPFLVTLPILALVLIIIGLVLKQ